MLHVILLSPRIRSWLQDFWKLFVHLGYYVSLRLQACNNTLPFVFSLKLLKPTGHVMHQRFNIQQLYSLSTLYLCVLYLRRRWVDNIRVDLLKVGCVYMDWIGLAKDRDWWRTLVSAVMNLRVP